MSSPLNATDAIHQIITEGGITLQLDARNNTYRSVGGDYWYFPVAPDATVIIDGSRLEAGFHDFVTSNRQVLMQDDTYLGVWRNPSDSKYYLDICTRDTDHDRALTTARSISDKSDRTIKSIYNPEQDATIAL